MQFLKMILMIVQIVSGLGIIGFVLLQHGKGADAGAGFGGGSSSNSIFGASGSANFLSRSTAILAVIFFTSTIATNWFSGYKPASNLLEQLSQKNTKDKTLNPPSASNTIPQ